jgi:hypothetical protein
MNHTVIKEQSKQYIKASKKEKGVILRHIMAVTGMPSKSVIRALGRERKRSHLKPPRKVGRKLHYTAETEAALAWVWEQYEYPCAERLIGEIPEAIRIFTRDGMWGYSEHATQQLWDMSLGAMKVRTVQLAKKKGLLRGISTTQAGALIKSIPTFFGDWSSKGPGYSQIDTVVHSGPKLMGTMGYTANNIDVATYWQEMVAQLGKGERATLVSMRVIQHRQPFPWLGAHPDSGSEFINYVAKAWANEQGIELTRSRPSKSNDNCFIEQRNRVDIRKYVGYERYDAQEAVDVMNELYVVLRLYVNFFQPTYKLIGKEKRVKIVDGQQAAKPYKRIYDKVRTPYQRVLDHPDIDQAVKDKLTKQYESLNPKVLRDKLKLLKTKLQRTQREQGYHY